jgi:DNA-directed RNA polymerase specialized sigma24 family protein
MDVVSERKKDWVLTQEAFDRLLALLGEDRDRAGESYEAARSRLVRFFGWNGSDAPEELADETLNRVARKVTEGEEVRNLSAYLLGVARLILLETFKERVSERAALDALPATITIPAAAPDPTEPRRACLEYCLRSLSEENRELIVEYYSEEKRAKIQRRRGLAEKLGIPLNALRIRAHRIRAKLEECVRACVEREATST